jgi:hypothetical protein
MYMRALSWANWRELGNRVGMVGGWTMDYGDLDQGDWARYLPVFKNVLRPSFIADSVAELGEFEDCGDSITQARAEDGSFGVLGDKLVNLIFDGHRNWYQDDDAWILQEIAQVLDDSGQQQYGLLSGLQAITGSTDDSGRKTALQTFIAVAGNYANQWQQEAGQEGYTRAEAVDEAAELEGTPNTTNWRVSRTPGTYYYVYVDNRYLYSDLPEAPIGEWETLPVRERLAAELAQAWGIGFCTPTGGNPDYDGDYVFALDKKGPWLTQPAAEAALAAKAVTVSAQPASTQSATAVPHGPEAVIVQRLGENRAAKLEELFAALTAAGWDPDQAENDDSMPTRDEVIERFDQQVRSGI